MAIWSTEAKELEKLYKTVNDYLPIIGKEIEPLIKSNDANVVLLYARRSLEVIVTELCETELKRPRKTEPLKGIIDKLNREDKVPSHIITSMHSLNSLAAYGAHPKDFDPEQVKPVLSNLSIVIKWYLKYKRIEIPAISDAVSIPVITDQAGSDIPDTSRLEKSVAVLPFRNDSPNEENAYFINGLMDEILNNLQRIREIRVISLTSVEQYRNQTKSIPEIARELDVNYIVEGSGQRYGNNFRLRAQLIMAAQETHLWGESFQQEIIDIKDIFNIQSQIAENIASELKAVITPDEKKLIEKVPTANLKAYEAYLKGQSLWRKLTSADLDTAMQYFELAKEKDPNYALAYAGICDVWIGRQQMGFSPPDEAGPKAFEAAMKALELDNTRAEVHYTLALMYTWGMFDWKSGENSFKKAIELKPTYPEAHIYYSHLLNILLQPEKAREHAELAIRQDPANPLVIVIYAVNLIFFHEYEKALETGREVLKMDPSSGIAAFVIAYSLMHLGKHSEMPGAFIKIFELQYKIVIEGLNRIDVEGDYIKALELLAEAAINERTKTYILPTDIAQIFVALGDKERVIEWVEKGIEEHDPGLPYFRLLVESLGADPRFDEICEKLKLP